MYETAYKMYDAAKNPLRWVSKKEFRELLDKGLLTRDGLKYRLSRQNIRRLHGNDQIKQRYKAFKVANKKAYK